MISSRCEISLREVSEANKSAISSLSVSQAQSAYVVSTSVAITDAADSENDWIQAIYADETPVGLAVVKRNPESSHYFLWRLMIDLRYQGLNFGSRAIDLLVSQIKSEPDIEAFYTSVVPGELSPQKFYERLGFKLTGETFENEAVMRLPLESN